MGFKRGSNHSQVFRLHVAVNSYLRVGDGAVAKVALLVTALLQMGGCSDSGWSLEDYKAVIESGLAKLPVAEEMLSQFPTTEHMIIMYGNGQSSHYEWQTESYFSGRYSLNMSVDVQISADGRRIESHSGEPRFLLLVFKTISEDRKTATYYSSRELRFGTETWVRFRDSGFDLRTIDSAFDGTLLPGFSAFAERVQANRRVWRKQ